MQLAVSALLLSCLGLGVRGVQVLETAPHGCDAFAAHSDHLLLAYSVHLEGRPPIAGANPPDALLHVQLEPALDHLMIKGLCLNGTRQVVWSSAKDLNLQPFAHFDADSEEFSSTPLILTVTLHHLTSTRDYEVFDAFRIGNASRVLSLIDEHVGINAVDEFGSTLLMMASQAGDIQVVAALLNTRRPTVEINTAKSNGFTALFYAVGLRSEGVLHALLRRGADPNKRLTQLDGEGNTPLHLACALDKPKHAQLLLQFGADPRALNVQGLSPLEVLPGDALTSTRARFRAMIEAVYKLDGARSELR